ncbi:MAG: aldose 1-epimerase [Casimicrobiaceae bacterium]
MPAAPTSLVAGTACATLLPDVGGAIASFEWRDVDVLRPMPAEARTAGNVRLAACYPLVPYSNRIRGARLRFDGADHVLTRNFGDHPHAIHGVGWQRRWRVERASASGAVMTLEHMARGDDAQAWPWPFHATQSFDLASRDDSTALVVTLTIANTGDTPFPFGLGWHPFFPRDASTMLRFDAREVWRNDATQLPVQRLPADGPWNFATSRDPGEGAIDNVFGGWPGVATIASPAHGLTTKLIADRACDRLVVYAPPGHDFIAIEPVTHETDAFNRAHDGVPATGMRVLRPGGAFSCTMRIDVTATLVGNAQALRGIASG